MATLSDQAITTSTRDDLVCANLPLVGHIVRDVLAGVPSHVHRDDLVSAGMLALVQAARSYDASQGVPFARFASRRIRGALLDELRGMDWASRSVRRRAREVDSIRAQLSVALGRTPTQAEIAATSGLTMVELADHERDVARANLSSLHALPEGEEDRLPCTSTLEPIDVLLRREQLAYLSDAVQQLPPRLRTVVEGYFIQERPMAELAADLGVTESRISQMRAEALRLLRHALDVLLGGDPVPTEHTSGVAQRRRAAYVLEVARVRSTVARLAHLPGTELTLPA
jgi:RNA polymerase sigma factor for flagellar operon FliA